MFPCSPVALNSCLYLLEWTRPFLITSFIRILSVSTTKITAISSLVPFLYMRTIDRKRERLWRRCRTTAHFCPGPQINPLDSGWILFLMVSAGFWFLVCVQHLLLYNSVNVQPLHMQPDRNCRAETCVKANEKKSSSAMLNGCNGFFLGPGCTPRLRFMNTGLVIVKFSYFHWLMIEFICQRVNKSATGLTGDYFASLLVLFLFLVSPAAHGRDHHHEGHQWGGWGAGGACICSWPKNRGGRAGAGATRALWVHRRVKTVSLQKYVHTHLV